LAGQEAAGLHAVAAGLHFAPAAGVVFAGVEEEPAAGFAGAVAEVRGLIGEEQVGGGLGEEPQGRGDVAGEAGPLPFEFRFRGDQAAAGGGMLADGVESSEGFFGNFTAIEESVGNGGDGFAKGYGAGEDLGALGGGRFESLEFAGFVFA